MTVNGLADAPGAPINIIPRKSSCRPGQVICWSCVES